MNLENRLHKIATEDAHNAYVLLYDEGPEDWRDEPERWDEALARFRRVFEECASKIEIRFGVPSYIEREHTKHSPKWAPMGLYADWFIEESDSVICLFMGGDGNPEDPMVLIAGRTASDARFSPDDPWNWHWID